MDVLSLNQVCGNPRLKKLNIIRESVTVLFYSHKLSFNRWPLWGLFEFLFLGNLISRGVGMALQANLSGTYTGMLFPNYIVSPSSLERFWVLRIRFSKVTWVKTHHQFTQRHALSAQRSAVFFSLQGFYIDVSHISALDTSLLEHSQSSTWGQLSLAFWV